jgi:hypothetical protein
LRQIPIQNSFKPTAGGSELRKYRTWALLNAEGKAAWGDVFPDGQVPVQSIFLVPARLDGFKEPEPVAFVDWKVLSVLQQCAILEKLGKKSGASKNEILSEIQKVGLPLRQRYAEVFATTGLELFL